MAKFLKDNGPPSVIGVQECNNTQAAEITHDLGANYSFWGSGTSKIIWDTNKWLVLDQFQAGLPYKGVLGVPGVRPLTMLKLKSINTEEFAWFASTHLAVHIPNQEAQQEAQMKEIIRLIKLLPDHERVIIFGDFNNYHTTSSVRKIAMTAGYVPLRKKAGLDLVTGETWNSFNGWKITKREGRWLDDVLTSPAVKPYDGALKRTDSGVYVINASDHNGIRASVEF
jgi:endonuclease/exonuclease/phosphatase family metal-dependent hydrolase